MILNVLIGLPGVGKLTWAAENFNTEQIYSSDQYREKLYGDVNDQSHNSEVFDALYRDLENEMIKRNYHEIVFDATNINIKRRKHIIDMAHKHNVVIEASVFTEPLSTILDRNRQRDRQVPEESITQKYKTFRVPVLTEEWDGVTYWSNATVLHRPIVVKLSGKKWYDEVVALVNSGRLQSMLGFDQHNPHHTLDLWQHTHKLIHHLHKHDADWRLLLAGLYHDVGKLETQTFDDDGVAHYYGHQYVSTQIAVQELCDIVDAEDLLHITSLIHYHMDPYNCKTVIDVGKLARRLNHPTLLQDLLILHEADQAAH